MDVLMGDTSQVVDTTHSTAIGNSETRAEPARGLTFEAASQAENEDDSQTDDEEEGEDEDDEEEEDDDEDEDEGEYVDEDGFPMIEEPSEDIVGDLEDALSGDLDFQGTFAFCKTYDDAPNPCLSLEGLGMVGLPLSQREARVVIENSIQAPFGQGERTVVDREVRDTWEMDASKVQFKQAGWKPFMARVVSEVCESLGVNLQASKPRCELYKLLVYETGSHFLPHVDTEKTNGMFASIIVVLPSHFTGGDAHVSHGSLKSVFNTSGPSSTKTTVLSWYTDVTHEIKPITSGYRLAISYNLFHTTTSLRPSISAQVETINTLRHILLSWKQQESEPEKIIYMLDHKYSRASLSASALKGKDAHIVGALDSLSKELGFCIGLAHIEHHESGTADDCGGGYYGHRRRGYYCAYDESEEDDGDVEMDEVLDTNTTVENLVDLEGKLISSKVNFDDSETIPANFNDYFEGASWDKQEYEGYQGNYGGTIDRFYRRSAVVIWPRWTRLGNEKGDRRTLYALQRLHCVDGPEPTAEELDLFNYACRMVVHNRHASTVRKLCQAARQWKRADLWVQAAVSPKGGNLARMLPLNEVAEAALRFGLPEVVKGLRDVVLSDLSLSSRLNYLSSLETWAGNQQVDPSHVVMLSFVEKMRTYTFDNLPRIRTSELSPLTDAAMKYGGGIQCLKTRSLLFDFAYASMVADINGRVLPHVLKAPVNVEVLQSYAEYLSTEMNRFATETADQSHIREIITELLTSALKHLDLFRMQAITNPSQNSNPPTTTHKGDPASAMRFITQCLESGNPTIAFAALRQMTDINGQTEDIAQARATTVLLPLLELLEKEPKARLLLSQQRELVTELLTSIADHLDLFQLKRVANPSGPGYSYSQSNSETTVKGDPGPALSLVIRCLEYGSPTLAACALRRMKNVDGKSKEVADAQVITVLLPLLELMGKNIKTKSFLSNNQEIVTELLTAALNGVDLFQIKTATTKAGWPSYRVTPTTKGDPAMAMDFIAQCLESGNMAIASNALRRMAVMYGQPSDMAQVRATTVLLPLLQHLQKDPRTNRFLPDLPLACISEAAVPHALRAFKARAGSLTEDSICLLLDSIVIGKTPQLLTTAILPAIRSFPWNEASWKSWMEQVLSRRRAFAANNLTFSTQISAAVAEMAKTYAQKVTLPTLQPYYGARVPTDQSAKFLTILNTCVRLGGTAALEVALKRLLEHKSTVEYLQNALVPLIPGLCQLAQRQGLSVSAEPFASSIRKIMDNWTKSVLGPKPDEATSAPLLAKLKKYTCSQSDCLKVQRFLLIPNTRNTLRLERIGAPTRKHIEKELQVHAAGAATFEMIRTTPQGLQIKKHDSLYQSARWKTIQQEGMKVLKEIGQLAPLQAIWGSAYPTFMNKMGITPTNTPTVAHASNTNTTRSAAPIAGPSQSLQSRVAVPTAAPHRPRPPHPGRSIPVTPAKRKAAAAAADDDDDDIIDLTITP